MLSHLDTLSTVQNDVTELSTFFNEFINIWPQWLSPNSYILNFAHTLALILKPNGVSIHYTIILSFFKYSHE